jgi:hypothetical protein
MGLMARFQETLHRLAMIGEGFAGDAASPGSQDRGPAARGGAGGYRVTGWGAWNGASAGRWRRAR